MAEMLRPELCEGPELTCGGRLDLLLDYIDNSLPQDLQQPVHSHIESCPACTHLLSVYRSTFGVPLAWRVATQMHLPPAFVDATVRAARAVPRKS